MSRKLSVLKQMFTTLAPKRCIDQSKLGARVVTLQQNVRGHGLILRQNAAN